jgi:hypothetical protein
MKPHKHAELIKAWADGAEIEVMDTAENKWFETGCPMWVNDHQYRIKQPTITVTIPKPVLVNLERDLYISFRFESVQDAEKARDAIKELIK